MGLNNVLVNDMGKEWNREIVRQAEVVKPTMRKSTKENILNCVAFSKLKTCK